MVRRARPVVAVVDRRAVAQHLLIVLELLALLLVLVDCALGRVLCRAGWISCGLGALGEVMGRTAALLARPVPVLVILVVCGVGVMEMTLLLQVARRVRARLHVGCDVPRVRPCVLAVAKVLRTALLVGPVARSVTRPKGLDVVGSSGLVRTRVAAIPSWRSIVSEGCGRPVPWVHRLRLPLLSGWL